MSIIRFNPLREFDSFFNSYNRSLANSKYEVANAWVPNVDILEKDNQFVIKAELAGIPKEDIKVEIDDNVLTLSGERKSEVTDEKQHRVERYYGKFSRRFSLPDNVNEAEIKAESKDGILVLTLPKQEVKAKLKQVEIH